jgi:hypothetical protein
MAFFVYLFVLVVAGGSILFGLDLTQSPLQPPSYATPGAQTTASAVPVAPTKIKTSLRTATVSVPKVSAPVRKSAVESVGIAANAQASNEETQTQPATTAAVSASGHCAIDACTAAYRSFRASDCTYEPLAGERRLCTKGVSSKRVAAARPAIVHHASRSGDARRAYNRAYAERDNDRDSYAEPRRGGWAFDLFGR